MSGKSRRVPGELVPCSKCGKLKPWKLGAFPSEHGRPRQPCTDCGNAARAARARAKIDQTRRSGRARMAHWRATNPEKVATANRKPRRFDHNAARERMNRWRREHPGHRVTEVQRRRARIAGARGSHTRAQWLARVAFHGWRCRYCAKELTRRTLTKDHLIPLARGGSDWPANLVPACRSCNCRKQDRTASEFRGVRFNASRPKIPR